MALRVRPLTLKQANDLVSRWHRHHKPVVGHRFSLGVEDQGRWVGACIVGRPVARMTDQERVAEVTRLVTDGTKNACSILYAAAARAAQAMGFDRIQTFVLAEEPGTSLKASGWVNEGEAGGGQWVYVDHAEPDLFLGAQQARRTDQPTGKKVRWAKEF